MTKTKKPRVLTIKERMMVHVLPNFDWDVTKAALSVGYSRSYATTTLRQRAKQDNSLYNAIETRREEIQAQTWSVEGWRKNVEQGRKMCVDAKDRTNMHAYDQDIARHIGAFEADNRQRQSQFGLVLM